ncbi:MAG: four helix bundle protein [Planctomycetota bacterium]
MSTPIDRPAAAAAPAELLVLQKWEAFTAWLLNHTGRWPKQARFTLTQRLENHALDVTEMLVQARYEPKLRPRLLHEVNLRLERMRFLCRIAVESHIENGKGFETTLRQVDEVGRMVHGWRVAIGDRTARPADGVSAELPA